MDVPQTLLDAVSEEVHFDKAQWGKFVGAFDPQTIDPGFVVSRTQVGDGSFPVYAEYSDEGELLSLTIRFDYDEDEDDNEDD